MRWPTSVSRSAARKSLSRTRCPCRPAYSPKPLSPELSPNFGDGRSRSGGGGCGLTVGRLGDDLDPVVECHTENEFWQLVGAVETAPAFLRGFQQFEDHRERGPVGQAALRSDRAVAHGGEGAFNGVGGP